ncbi:hypothetical protein KJ854_03965, partial [Patescibacteria group bacterium]|nr:hypothetical protein [Patescibacteria group bacterium]
MNEEQKEQNIPAPAPSESDNQNIAPVKGRQLKNWIALVIVLVFIIGGYFVWQNYQKSKLASQVVPYSESSEKAGEKAAVSAIKSLAENRDMKRKIDLVNLLLALQNYKKDKNIYPSTNGLTEKTDDKNSTINSLVPKYIKNIPIDAQSPTFYYGYSSDGKSFAITARLENEKNIDCNMSGKICLYKLTEKNNEEELLKIVRENLEFISSVRIVSTSDWTTQKPGEDPYRLLGNKNTVSESMLDLIGKKAYTFSYQSDNKDKKDSESVIINSRIYSKNSMAVLTAGAGSWMEFKEGDELPGIPDTPGADNTFHMPDLSKVFSAFDFIRSVSDIKKITVESIENKEYYHLSLQPKHKERNKFLDEYLNREIGVYGTGKSIDELFASETDEEYIFEKEQVFKFFENNKQIVIPFSKLVTRPIFRVLLAGSGYDKNEYTVNVLSITGNVWVDKETFLPFRENTSEYDVRYDYNLETKEKGFWEEANEITGNIQYLDINKEFDI